MASQSRSPTQTATKRLLLEMRSQSQDPAPFLASLGPISDNELLDWEAVLKGVPHTSYESGLWKLSIRIPESYPLSPPNVKFETPICHPNVQFKVGLTARTDLSLADTRSLDWRDLLGLTEDVMVTGIHNRKYTRGNPPITGIPSPRQPSQRRYRLALERW